MSGPLQSLAKTSKVPGGLTISYSRSSTGLMLLQNNEKEEETAVVTWSPPPSDPASELFDFTTSPDNYVTRMLRAERTLRYLRKHPDELSENPTLYISDIRWFRYLSSLKHCAVASHAHQSQSDFIRLGLPGLFKTFWADHLRITSIADWDAVHKDSVEAFYHVTMALWFITTNPTHREEMFSELFEFILTMIAGDAFKSNYHKDRRVQDCLKALLGIVYQFVKHFDEAKKLIRGNGGVGFLQRITGHKAGYGKNVKGRALMILAYTLSEEEQKKMKVSESIIVFLIGLLKDCLKTENHRSTMYNYDAVEILSGMNRLAVTDSNKLTIGDNGGLQLYHQLLQTGTLPEQELACRGLWTLCFSELAAEYVSGNQEMLAVLQKMSKSEHESLRIAACGCLWTVHELRDQRKHSKQQAAAHRSGHVMISYSWAVQKEAKYIKKVLHESGYKVWLDIENMTGSTLSAMSQAIEKATVVLILLSEHYKDSPACRAEAEYAYKLQREIIPLKVQPGYSVDGWLSMLIGMKMSFDLTQNSDAEHAYQQLINALGDRGKGPPGEENEEETLIEEVKLAAPSVPVRTTAISTSAISGQTIKEQPECVLWDDQQIIEWFDKNKLHDIRVRLGEEVSGEILAELKYMLLWEPEQYYTILKKDLQLPTVVILRFSASLRALQ